MKVKTIYASSVAVLDSDVWNGGGTDDTDVLQNILNTASENTGIHLIIDGAALVRGLKVHSNTTIECLNSDCGFFLADNCNCAVLQNANPSFDGERKDKNITLIGGTYNQNCNNQVHTTPDEVGNIAPGFKMTIVIELYGVENLLIRDIIIRNQRTYAMLIANWERVTMENINLSLPCKMVSQNQDGIHFFGPGRFLNMRNIGGCTGDDIIALAPDERDRVSSITDVLIDGVYIDNADQAIRLLSRDKGCLDRVTIKNVYGKYTTYGFYIQPWYSESAGNFGSIQIENVNLIQTKAVYDYQVPFLFRIGGKIDNLVLRDIHHMYPTEPSRFIEIGYYSTMLCENATYERNGSYDGKSQIRNISIDGVYIVKDENSSKVDEYITVNCPVENFSVHNFNTIGTNEKMLEITPNGKIGCLTVT
jgi:hypothetical protein